MSTSPDLIQVFRATAARRPAHRAVEAADGSFTFEQLDRLSDQLANRLRSLGVGPESRVGVSLSRGAAELLTMLATSKAGGAYVPLDPTHPTDRLELILEGATPEVLVVDPDSPLPTPPGCQRIVVQGIEGLVAGFAATPLEETWPPGQLLYVLFTSGSTGKPKGVEIPRGAFNNFLGSMAHTPGLKESDRLLAITTTSFDISGLELFLPLWVGATVVIADRHTTRDPRRLKTIFEEQRINVLQATPATFRLLLDAGFKGDPALKLMCGGEAMSPALADRLLSCCGELWNMYGPTETTVWSTVAQIKPGYDRITIGLGIDETQVYILDDALNEVAVGSEGELWIGGTGLARGYRNRPELTAERFVQNPRGPKGDLIYRTGDLGRQLADGRFECLGRLDHQVKMRGFRVELGEIESVLRKVPGLADVLVLADAREDGEQRLVAYWIGAATRDALVAEAKKRLPAYMVPAAWVNVPAFPLNTNGKIDRKALPKPEALVADAPAMTLPRTDAETLVAAVWCEVLKVPQVPVDESFFVLGGTSVLAVQVVGRLEKETGAPVSLQAFFETPTVEGIAASLGQSASPDAPVVVWLRRGEDGKASSPLFCLFGVALYQALANALPRDRAVVGMHVPFRYQPGAEARPGMARVAAAYVEQIRKRQAHGPYHLLGLCYGGIVAWEVARQLEAAGEEVARVTIIDAILPSAVTVDRLAQAQGRVRAALADPLRFARRVRDKGQSLGARLPLVRDAMRKVRPPAGGPIDLPVDGPEHDVEVEGFSREATRVRCPVLVVRATAEVSPSWQSVSRDQGWAARAGAVDILDVEADHLGVLRPPHVAELAAALVSPPKGR
ncbi:MAG: amino acid adenylation domain-containing protein [Deltaproteobacteria bacterium]|nr:amino acid adenylation domain-containing protein [Deltaproteobacteria bacterium]